MSKRDGPKVPSETKRMIDALHSCARRGDWNRTRVEALAMLRLSSLLHEIGSKSLESVVQGRDMFIAADSARNDGLDVAGKILDMITRSACGELPDDMIGDEVVL